MTEHTMSPPPRSCWAFQDDHLLAEGALADVAAAVRAAIAENPEAAIVTFDDQTGAVIDLDLRGSAQDVQARYSAFHDASAAVAEAGTAAPENGMRGRGRPKLGVVAREITLLPRHWDWLATQQGGASHALRRLVEEARLRDGGQSRLRLAREASYRFMSAMAGNQPGFEEASRALFVGDEARFQTETAAWPVDIRNHAHRLGWAAPRAV